MAREVMLSTIDNPFNYFTEFRDWFNFDCQRGYYSCAKVARLSEIKDSMSQLEIDKEIERAIDSFLSVDFTGLYCKVINETPSSDNDDDNVEADDEEITIE